MWPVHIMCSFQRVVREVADVYGLQHSCQSTGTEIYGLGKEFTWVTTISVSQNFTSSMY